MTEVAWDGPWPLHAVFDDRGLVLAGTPAAALAERFATPLLVLDEQEVRERCRRARSAFPRVTYAVKAFTAHAMLRLALDEGLDLLAATGGEVQACLRAGAPASRVVLHGNAKSDEELALAVDAGVGLVISDGLDELQRLDGFAREAGRVQPVLLRVVPEVEVRTHEASRPDTTRRSSARRSRTPPMLCAEPRRCPDCVSTVCTPTSGRRSLTRNRICAPSMC